MDSLLGITFGDWLKLLRENNYAVQPRYWGRALFITQLSMANARGAKKEKKRYEVEINQTQVKSPIFILGHWRSGTTLLHNMFALDERFAFPNNFQISHPHTFLIREKLIEKRFKNVPAQKRPMDNIKVRYDSPGEDEQAMAVISRRSPLISWSFPKNEEMYARYHTFTNAPQSELASWRNAMIYFFQKLTWRYKKPLVLKSPVHTGRIRILLETFPDAKFIHIYRDPFTVFQSTKRLYKKMIPRTCFHLPDMEKFDDIIIQNYKTMYQSFLDEKSLIPDGNFYETRFEDFEVDLVGEMEKIYNMLSIKNFAYIKSKIENFASENKKYKKNFYIPLSDDIKYKIQSEWQSTIEEWEYDYKSCSWAK